MSFQGETKLTPEQWLQQAVEAQFPIKPLPAGVGLTFKSGHTTVYQLYMTAGVWIPLLAIFSSFRLLHAIKFKRKIFLADDSILGLVFSLCLALIAMTLAAVSHYGFLGRRAWTMALQLAGATERLVMLTLLVHAFAPLTICAVKVSALTLYLRVYGRSMRCIRVTCVFSIILLLAYHISLAIALGVMCAPYPEAGYSQVMRLMASIPDQCRPARIIIWCEIVGNHLIDEVLISLPLLVVWTMFWKTHRTLQNPP